jgi:hypothetical protein
MHLSQDQKLGQVLGEKILYEITPEKRDEILRQLTPRHIHPDDVDDLKEVSYRFRRKKQETRDHLQEQSEERREAARNHWLESGL